MAKMSEAQVRKAIGKLPDWSIVGEAIQRTYEFKDFVQAMRFVNRIADAAESDQHHPDILVRWNRVTLTLTTHDDGGIGTKDFEFAAKADASARA